MEDCNMRLNNNNWLDMIFTFCPKLENCPLFSSKKFGENCPTFKSQCVTVGDISTELHIQASLLLREHTDSSSIVPCTWSDRPLLHCANHMSQAITYRLLKFLKHTAKLTHTLPQKYNSKSCAVLSTCASLQLGPSTITQSTSKQAC